MRRFVHARRKLQANALTPSQKIWRKINRPQKFKAWLRNFKGKFDILAPFIPYNRVDRSYFVDEVVRKAIRSLILLICRLQKKKLCLLRKALHPNNMMVIDGSIKLRLMYVKSYSVARARKDFQNLRNFIFRNFFVDEDRYLIPHDMQNLLRHLERYDSKKEYLIRNHFALMSDQAKETMMVRWANITPQFTKHQQKLFEDACNVLPDIFERVRNLDDKDPFKLVLKEATKINKGKVGHQPRYFRHLIHHLLDYCRKGLNEYDKPKYVSKDVVKMILAMFPENIILFFESLDDHGILDLMKPEDSF